MTKILLSIAAITALGLAACTPTAPVQDFASKNGIALKYNAYDEIPTLTPEAQEMAIQHCAKYGKYANYRGASVPNPLTAEEVHRFVCENNKTDDSVVIAAQSQRPSYVYVPTIQQPTHTTCTTVGYSTTCSSY